MDRGSLNRIPLLLFLALLSVTPQSFGADEVKRTSSQHNFRLPSTAGELVQLFEDPSTKLTVICFLGTECPLAKLYGPRLQKLADQYADQKVQFIGINSNVQDSIEEIRQYATQHQITFPMLSDKGNRVADAYEATRTTEVFLIDRLFQIRYHGRVDDQYQPGLSRSKPSRHDLQVAIDEILAGQQVSKKETKPVGCILGKVPSEDSTTKYTFAKDVSRILQKHCVECHRSGEIGPFALTDYDEVVGWGEMLIEVIDQKRMPPWHADPSHGEFTNARTMLDEEIAVLKNWVAGGMPLGNPKDLPAALPAASEWELNGTPDVVLNMGSRPFSVPAQGTVEYQYFVVDPKFAEDKWVTQVQVVPGNRSVVHHSIVFIRPPDGSNFSGVGWLGGYVPGQKPLNFKPGYARHVPAGSKLVFQMHYTPTGTPQNDLTKIGLVFANEEDVTHEVFTVVGINTDFEIPPNSPDFEVEGKVDWFPKHGELLGVTPHMHLRGKSFQVTAKSENESDILLNVPNYDFNWQHFYIFDEPLSLENIENIRFTATFDNSKGNPVNPDPTEHVSWGDQTWQEMAIAFFAIAQRRDGKFESKSTAKKPEASQADEEYDLQVEEFVQSFFRKFDRNRDGQIFKDELPLALETFGFRILNQNRDDHISREEIQQLARRSLKNR